MTKPIVCFPVDVSYLRQCLNIDFSKEEHSLDELKKQIQDAFSEFQMLGNIEVASQSIYFKSIWLEKTLQAKKTEFENTSSISLNDVLEKIYKPMYEDFSASYKHLKELSMPLADLECQIRRLTKEELQMMGKICSKDNDDAWIRKTALYIKRYRDLCLVREQAELLMQFKNDFSLKGDFSNVENFCVCNHFTDTATVFFL